MRWARYASWALVAAGVTALGWAAAAPLDAEDRGSPIPARAAVTGRDAPRVPSDSVIATIAREAPFRAIRRASGVAYDPVRQATPPPAAVPRPTLVLVGVLEGPAATAVVEGFPGAEGGRVVRVGDVVGGLRVARIGSGVVRIVGMDTMWVLKVRELR